MKNKMGGKDAGILAQKSIFYGLLILSLVMGLAWIGSAQCMNVTDDLYINEDTVLCPGVYNINDSHPYNGVIVINSSDVVLDCNNTIMNGSGMGSGFGIAVSGYDNVIIKNCKLMNYDYGIFLNSSNNTIFFTDVENKYSPSAVNWIFICGGHSKLHSV